MHSGDETLRLGAVAYDPKVVTIWDGFAQYFAQHGLSFDYVLYTNYESQVLAHLAGHFHVAWNSPLAWIQTERLAKARGRRAAAIAMRDSDRDLTSVVLVRSDSPIRKVPDLAGRRVAVGAADSPQATLIPLLHLAENGIEPGRDIEVVHHDVLSGKHGDHIGGERDAVQALAAGAVDAACVLNGNQLLFAGEGTIAGGALRILTQTGVYDHCNFTILDNASHKPVARFHELLLGMSHADPAVRPLLDLEGLKQWMDGRVSGYTALEQAVDRFGYLDSWLATVEVS